MTKDYNFVSCLFLLQKNCATWTWRQTPNTKVSITPHTNNYSKILYLEWILEFLVPLFSSAWGRRLFLACFAKLCFWLIKSRTISPKRVLFFSMSRVACSFVGWKWWLKKKNKNTLQDQDIDDQYLKWFRLFFLVLLQDVDHQTTSNSSSIVVLQGNHRRPPISPIWLIRRTTKKSSSKRRRRRRRVNLTIDSFPDRKLGAQQSRRRRRNKRPLATCSKQTAQAFVGSNYCFLCTKLSESYFAFPRDINGRKYERTFR